MNQPKTYAKSGWNQAWPQLFGLYLITVVVGMHLFNMHWAVAGSAAPFIMLALLFCVFVLVEAFWLLVVGLDKLGEMAGLRKSPLT